MCLGLWLSCCSSFLCFGAGPAFADAKPTAPSVASILTPDEVVPLWPGPPRGAPDILPSETIVFRTNPFGLVDRAAHNVAAPSLSIFRPKQSNGAAILIVPGGGFSWVVIDKEGFEGANYFAKLGYHVYVLRYRLPHQGWHAGPDTPLQDAQRAIRLMRARAQQDHIHLNNIMVMGFSAGGHVAGALAMRFDDPVAPPVDNIDQLSARPDLAALIYPVVTMVEPYAHPKSRDNLIGKNPSPLAIAKHSLETNPNPRTPPIFILHAGDDRAVPVENALRLYSALRAAHIPATLHAFEHGGHGFGFRGLKNTPLEKWPTLILDWSQTHNFPPPIAL
jgi:acetyl esterase/lipase